MRVPTVLAALALLFITPLHAQEAAAESQLDELLKTPISTAAKYEQEMSDVAASVTVVTAEEIARYGWHTLEDVLNAARGVYTTHDHGYTYLGVRGLGLPTDYNNRFLVLLDGHPLIENVSGSIGIDTTLALDLSQFARIEFVRGPGSVLYGTGAMFGVINLITKDEGERASAMIGAGTYGLRTGAARAGFGRGAVRASISASWQEKQGRDFSFREIAHPGAGVVHDRDYDDYESILGTLQWRNLRVLAMHSSRTKGVPTASWGTIVGGDERITDGRTLFAADYHLDIDPARTLNVSAFYDRFGYQGRYPEGDSTYLDESQSSRIGAELRYVWDIRPNHRLTLGAEAVHNRRALFKWGTDLFTNSVGGSSSTQACFLQAESQVSPRLAITAGLSLDRHPRVSARLTPRVAAIFRPSPSSTVKALYGRAFRVPNTYELEYESDGFLASQGLEPEDLRTLEFVWEQRIGSDVLATMSLFEIRMDDVIRLQTVPEGVQHQNIGSAHSHGMELQFDHRTNSGVWSYASLTYQKAEEAGGERVNSPEQMFKAGVSTPTARRLFAGAELQYQSGRLTLQQQRTDDVLLANLNVGFAVTPYLQITATTRNLFDTTYATPGGPEHRQDVIEQDGRTVLVRFRVRRR